jgi:hypothetical protein
MTIQDIYQYIYLLLATFLLYFWIGRKELALSDNYERTPISPICVAMVVLLSLFIGFRPVDVGSDTTQYIQHYFFARGKEFHFNADVDNLVFDNFFAFLGSCNYDIKVLFTIMSLLYFSGIYVACRKLFPQNQEIAFFSCLVAFSTFSYGTDGIKAGAGASVFLVALAYREKKWLSILLSVLSIGIHHSMMVVVYAYIISYFYKKTEAYFYVWLFALFIAVVHISIFQDFFVGYLDEKDKKYFLRDYFVTGFRPDFIIYSAMPVLVGYIMLFKRNIYDEIYELWLRMYLATNSAWMLCMYASYTNRIAYLSWFMYPIVLLYPYFSIYWREDQLEEGTKVVKCHLWFTIFMVVFYYGFLR